MVVNPTVRFVAALPDLIRHRIDSAEGMGELTPTQNGILHFVPDWCREQDLFQQDIEKEFNLLIYMVRILSGLMMPSMVFGMVIMARPSTEHIVGAGTLMLPEGCDTMLTGNHKSPIKKMRGDGRVGRQQGPLC